MLLELLEPVQEHARTIVEQGCVQGGVLYQVSGQRAGSEDVVPRRHAGVHPMLGGVGIKPEILEHSVEPHVHLARHGLHAKL
eukprot:scaffold6742_cov118-Isochrysis_galbana.AAC.2